LNGQGRTRGSVAVLEVQAACNQSLAAILPNSEVDGRFLFQNLSARYEELRSLTGDDARNGLNLHLMRSLPLLLPELCEQRGIARVLDAIDEAIEKTEAVITATEDVRKALLQELLTRGVPGWHTELKTVPGIGTIPACWEVVRLGEVATRVTDGVHQAVPFNDEGEIPFLFVSCITDGGIDWRRAGRIARETYSEITRSFRPTRGDVLYTAVGSYGNAALVDVEREFAFQRHIAVIRPKPNIASEFLALTLSSPLGRSQADKVAVGNAQKTVTLDALKKFVLPLPPDEEQNRIAELLAAVDLRIATEQCQLEVLKRIKDLSADALLSGRVRVPVREEDLSG